MRLHGTYVASCITERWCKCSHSPRYVDQKLDVQTGLVLCPRSRNWQGTAQFRLGIGFQSLQS